VTTLDYMDVATTHYIVAHTPIGPTRQGRVLCADSNGVTAPNCPAFLP
jgi:hypothetical protein